ncbi:hypothetical protein FIBSPDRAFT_1055513 [Athelia psychrophila]|uniref:Uncharacterized protein n=1 Tax=Athelia psychrophila TaxID=1759441 RepID=A0A167TJA4_9AGAM|nr:hypothetical protein FIBSPDRAFT_1055513 [Fibularhizoctonia sp. CBS 109695]
MDHGNLHENLFSRGGQTPPSVPRPTFAQSSSSSPSHLDTLFQNLSAPSSTNQVNKLEPEDLYSNPVHALSNMSINDDAHSTSSAPIMHSPADRQSALLSLLGSVSSPTSTHQGLSSAGHPPQPQTPPAPSQRTGNSPNNDNELQGKFLLEQLMAG